MIPAAIAGLTALVFASAVRHEFLDWDDATNLVDNPHFRGFTTSHLAWMFTAGRMGHYIPVTWLSFALDHAIGGMHPAVYHLTNILLHAASASLVYLLARRLLGAATGRVGLPLAAGAAVSALFFALHPLRAEPVGWATERREVLSAFFALLAILGYLRAVEVEGRQRLVRLALSVAAYVLALGAKASVMTLPLLLVILDVYPLHRLHPSPRTWLGPAARRIWAEKLPYALVALTGAVVAYLIVHANTYVTSLAEFGPSARVIVALYGLAFYASRTVVPIGLGPLYELPTHVDALALTFLVPALAVAAVLIGVVVRRRAWPAGPWLVLAYIVALAPVLGFVHSGFQLVHDRYSYLSCLGWAFLLGAGTSALLDERRPALLRPAFRRAALVSVVIWLAALAVLTRAQLQIWRNDLTLWQAAVDVAPDCGLCHGNLGAALYRGSQYQAALAELERAVALRPDRPTPRYNLALTLIALHRPAQAIPHLQHLIERDPRHARAHEALGAAWIAQARYADALISLREAIALGAASPIVDTHLALTLHELGRSAEAVPLFRRAVAAWPQATPPRVGLVRAYLALGDRTAARGEYEGLAALDPRLAARVTAGLSEPLTKENSGGHDRTP
jgi:protein O-mannosyl-transferase